MKGMRMGKEWRGEVRAGTTSHPRAYVPLSWTFQGMPATSRAVVYALSGQLHPPLTRSTPSSLRVELNRPRHSAQACYFRICRISIQFPNRAQLTTAPDCVRLFSSWHTSEHGMVRAGVYIYRYIQRLGLTFYQTKPFAVYGTIEPTVVSPHKSIAQLLHRRVDCQFGSW